MAKQKKKRFNNSAQVDEKYLGPAPEGIYFQSQSGTDYARALSWYNYFYTVKEGRKWLEDYIKSTRSKEALKTFKQVSDKYVRTTPCWIAKMMEDGCTFGEDSMQYLESKIDECMAKANVPDDDEEAPVAKVVTARISPFVRVLGKAKNMMEELETVLDDFVTDYKTDFSMYTFITANPNPQFTNMALTRLKSLEAEYVEYANDFIEEVGKVNYKKQLAFYQEMISDLTRGQENRKILRKPRVTKISLKPVAKTDGFKYQERFDSLKLVSLKPSEIVGAQQAWIYNVKYKALICYTAIDERGLGVNGSSITNFNEATTLKKTLRKPENELPVFFQQGKPALKKFLLTSDPKVNTMNSGRSHPEALILKVVK